MLRDIAESIKHYWAAGTAIVAMLGLAMSGVTYYARAEATHMIDAALVKPLDKLNKRADDVDNKLFMLQQDAVKQNEKLKGVEKQLDIIIELMKKDRNKDR